MIDDFKWSVSWNLQELPIGEIYITCECGNQWQVNIEPEECNVVECRSCKQQYRIDWYGITVRKWTSSTTGIKPPQPTEAQ
jgi:hypothetical protein